MIKQTQYILLLAVLTSQHLVDAVTHNFLAPLILQRGVLHYPTEPLHPEDCWSINTWAALYGRSAINAYIGCNDNPGCNNACNDINNTHDVSPIAQLFFGAPTFSVAQAFPNGTSPSIFGQTVTTLTPSITYDERGTFIGLHAFRKVGDSNWRIGVRSSIPIKFITINQTNCCDNENTSTTTPTNSGDVVVRRQEFLDAAPSGEGVQPSMVNAYRLDHLSKLKNIDGKPLVQYGDGKRDTTIAGIPVTAFVDRDEFPMNNAPAPVSLVRAEGGDISRAINVSERSEINNLARDVGPGCSRGARMQASLLDASGKNGSNGDRRSFSRNVNYASSLGNNTEEQKNWFLVPNKADAQSLYPEANAVQNAIDLVLARTERQGALQVTPAEYLQDNGVYVNDPAYASGAGDLYAEWYGEYNTDNGFFNVLMGMFIPTGHKMNCSDAYNLYWQPLGNNGHFEFRGGLEAGAVWNCLALRVLATYTHVFDHMEMRAPAFQGATISNIPVGPVVPAHVAWGYFWGNVDVTFFHPDCQNNGLVLGFEWFAKRRDRLCFCTSIARDFENNLAPLDDTILEQGTDTNLYKIRGECFFRNECGEFFIGAGYALSGRSALQEIQWHVGASLYF